MNLSLVELGISLGAMQTSQAKSVSLGARGPLWVAVSCGEHPPGQGSPQCLLGDVTNSQYSEASCVNNMGAK